LTENLQQQSASFTLNFMSPTDVRAHFYHENAANNNEMQCYRENITDFLNSKKHLNVL